MSHPPARGPDAAVPFEALDPQARMLFYLQAFTRLVLFWCPVTLVGSAVAAWQIAPMPALVGGAGWLFLQFLLAVWMPALAWDRWGYALRGDDLLITRGVLFRSVTAIPLGRVQHVDTKQGPLEQWLGLARVHVYTASGVGADGVIPGLRHAAAEALRDRLVAARQEDDGV